MTNIGAIPDSRNSEFQSGAQVTTEGKVKVLSGTKIQTPDSNNTFAPAQFPRTGQMNVQPPKTMSSQEAMDAMADGYLPK